MHDPMTVAHEIKWPFKDKNGFKPSIITIWHVDPETNVLGCRDDDSCGWFSPPYTEQDAEKVRQLAKDQYGQLFARKEALREEKEYASVCYNQDIYGAIYWSWRALKALGKKGWQYGKPPSIRELDAIYCLATNPVDNLQGRKINNIEEYTNFLFTVWRVFRKFQQFKRRYFLKCCICGKRGFKSSAMSDWGGTKKWHQECDKNAAKSQIK
jgi:hypothetical protein